MSAVRLFSAVLLAAGRSRRMGSDKALLAMPDGRKLWERQYAVLQAAGAAEIFISARPEQTWVPTAMNVVRDVAADVGPLAGMVAGLERAAHRHLAVLAVDLPAMSAEWFKELFAQVSPGVGVVGTNGEFFEPLAAIYPREILPMARGAQTEGEGSLQRLIAAAVGRGLMTVRRIPERDRAVFRNWNEPA